MYAARTRTRQSKDNGQPPRRRGARAGHHSSTMASTPARRGCGAGASPRRGWGKDMPVNLFCPWTRRSARAPACWASWACRLAPTRSKCCALVDGLAAAEAAACFCTTIKESVLGIPTEWTVGVSVLVSTCKTELPDGFKCV